jgi:hypothetical protein
MNALLLPLALTLAAAQPTLVRVAVVDNSPSMAGPRIEVVRNELRRVIAQMPPSPEFPLVLIVFHDVVEPTLVLTDSAAAEKAIAALRGDGDGTHIAPALVRAVEEINRRLQADNVLVLLYTDGEDGDAAGIRRAEEQLDRLFAERHRQGLSQTVFVKRWGGANAQLVEYLKKQGHAQLIDAGDFQMVAVSVQPQVALVAATRDPKDARRLQVMFTPTITLRGNAQLSQPLVLRFQCLNPGAAGEVNVEVNSTAPASRHTLVVPIPPEAEQSGQLDVRFRVVPTPPQVGQGSLLVPLLPTSLLAVTAPLPPLMLVNRLSATLEDVFSDGWADPLAQRVRCRAELVVSVTAQDAGDRRDRSMILHVAPTAGVRLESPSGTINITRLGEVRVPLTLDVAIAQTAASTPQLTEAIELELRVASTANFVTCQPDRVPVRSVGVAAPDRVTTTIAPTVVSVGKASWVDLVEGIAAFDAEVAFEVVGPIPQRTTFTLVLPPAVRGPVFSPGTTLHPGRTVVPMQVLARLAPGRTEQLDFSIIPPPALPAVEFRATSDFTLPVTAPPVGIIVHSAAGQPQTQIRVSVGDNQELLSLMLAPIAWGIDARHVRRAPNVTATIQGSAASVAPSTGALGAPQAIQLRLSQPMSKSFFLDVTQSVDVDLRPAERSAALVPGKLRVEVVRQAPFKRLLTYLAWALFPLGVLVLLYRIFRASREAAYV